MQAVGSLYGGSNVMMVKATGYGRQQWYDMAVDMMQHA